MFKLLDGMKKRLFLRPQNRDKFFEKKLQCRYSSVGRAADL